MLACDEFASSTSSTRERADAVRRYCRPGVIRADKAELFRRMVVNLFVIHDAPPCATTGSSSTPTAALAPRSPLRHDALKAVDPGSPGLREGSGAPSIPGVF